MEQKEDKVTKPGIDIEVEQEAEYLVEQYFSADNLSKGGMYLPKMIQALCRRVEQAAIKAERERCAGIANHFDGATTMPIYDWYATKSRIRDLILAPNGETK